MVKVCRVCGEGRPESEFYFDRSSGGFARESGAYNFVYANSGGYVAPRLRP